MAKYRKKPVVVEATRLTKEICEENNSLSKPYTVDGRVMYISYDYDGANIETLEGAMRADIGDYVITGIKGEKYPCKPDIFEAIYEKVDE